MDPLDLQFLEGLVGMGGGPKWIQGISMGRIWRRRGPHLQLCRYCSTHKPPVPHPTKSGEHRIKKKFCHHHVFGEFGASSGAFNSKKPECRDRRLDPPVARPSLSSRPWHAPGPPGAGPPGGSWKRALKGLTGTTQVVRAPIAPCSTSAATLETLS